MVPQDVSETTPTERGRQPLLVARLHVDLCRVTSAMCQRRTRKARTAA
jgi:hypothetical protein